MVEHVVLFQMKEGFTEEQEQDMLDHLYTLQYQLRGIIAVSVGLCSISLQLLSTSIHDAIYNKCFVLRFGLQVAPPIKIQMGVHMAFSCAFLRQRPWQVTMIVRLVGRLQMSTSFLITMYEEM